MRKSIVQNNIRKLRFEAGEMTQQELADEARVSRQTIVAIEKGNYSPSLELAFRLANIFNTPLEEVFTYDPKDDVPGRR
jgi:putative transcriptional regulator